MYEIGIMRIVNEIENSNLIKLISLDEIVKDNTVVYDLLFPFYLRPSGIVKLSLI